MIPATSSMSSLSGKSPYHAEAHCSIFVESFIAVDVTRFTVQLLSFCSMPALAAWHAAAAAAATESAFALGNVGQIGQRHHFVGFKLSQHLLDKK